MGRLGRSDGSAHDDALSLFDQIDRVRVYGPAMLAIRWGTSMVSVALAAESFARADWTIVIWCGVLLAYTVIRTVSPLRYVGTFRSLIEVVLEVALLVSAIVSTGYWASPFVFSLTTAAIVAGFARGFAFAIRISISSSLAISIPWALNEEITAVEIRLTVQWTLILLLVAVIAGYARRLTGEADRQRSLTLDRLSRLSDANALLFSLHRVAQSLPASLDMNDVLDTTITRLRGLLDFSAIALLIFDETDANWQVLRREGVRLPPRLGPTELPVPLRRALTKNQLVEISGLNTGDLEGLSSNTRSGLYTVLPARGSIIGLLAIEHRDDDHFGRRDVEILQGFVEPVALAIDNARWFQRLRTVGADEERTRIARDLHDRIGQSLAYLAFELDRLVARDGRGEDVTAPLQQLRNDVRGVIREVRDTLYDLRTDVSESSSIVETLEGFMERLRERTTLDIHLHADRGERLPILQEREMWRIAQEALVNVERHAHARRVDIRWWCNGRSAALEVADDGAGFPEGKAGRLDSYGIIGMRERASSIGATLEIQSAPNRGTTVRCVLSGE